MQTDKVETLVGFALRAGKVVFGTDNIEVNKRKELILLCKSLSDNSRERVIRLAGKVPVVLCLRPVSELTHRTGCKAIALTDKQMAKAILENMNGNYQVVTEVKN